MSEPPDQVQSLRDLASAWYALALACRRIGAMIERAAKSVLYESTNNSSISEANSEGTTPRDTFLPS